MHIVHVHISVKPEAVDAFRNATLDNARNSRLEPGVARFDFLQDAEHPTRFTLVEVYRSPDDVARHKETAHYKRWNEAVADFMAEPRTRAVYVNLDPPDEAWG